MKSKKIKVIGAGLAGTETAWQVAELLRKNQIEDFVVELYEMRPKVKTPAHHTDRFAELVCSNSLGSEFITTARGVLIREMLHYESIIVKSAQIAKVPAGQALAVDRDIFAEEVTSKIENHPLIEVIREEFTEDLEKYISGDDYIVFATGPLTSPSLSKKIQKLFKAINPEAKTDYLNFFDAAAPIIDESSVDMTIAYKGNRYDKGMEEGEVGDYINCPFYTQEEFDHFYNELINSEKAELKDFEKENMRFFDACQPIEQIASKGSQTLTFGPLKPVGLTDKREESMYQGKRAVAVVQLRQDNVVGSLYNMVGFQTNLKWGEQKRVFSLIPGLHNLEIVRYGVMHQNIFINSPELLNQDLSLRVPQERGNLPNESKIFFAGQITGVEGYTESAATGIVVARSIINSILGKEKFIMPEQTMLGSLVHYVSHCDPKRFQPINSNWGLLNKNPETLEKQYRKNKKLRYEFLADKALAAL
jgi:methylenetetrahydrofolate--tRNA-(uracil-5-)-methyltransferase